MKRPSGTKPRLSLPEPIFFTDRDLGKVVPGVLRDGGLSVERYCDHFQEANVPDEEWLAFVAQKGWIGISHDSNIRRDRVAVHAVMDNGGKLFILRGGLVAREMAALFLGALGSIHSIIARHHDEAFIAVVRRATVRGGGFKSEARVLTTSSELNKMGVQIPRSKKG